MNSATGILRDDTTDQDISVRRRGIKLVARKKGGKDFRIKIADDLLDSFHDTESARSELDVGLNADTSAHGSQQHSPSDERNVIGLPATVTFVLATAAAAGLMIGYLVGRRRD